MDCGKIGRLIAKLRKEKLDPKEYRRCAGDSE